MEAGFLARMQRFGIQTAAITVIAGTALLGMATQGSAPEALTPISPDEFMRAMAANQTPLIDSYLDNHLNPNARAAQDRPLLVAAVLQQDRDHRSKASPGRRLCRSGG